MLEEVQGLGPLTLGIAMGCDRLKENAIWERKSRFLVMGTLTSEFILFCLRFI